MMDSRAIAARIRRRVATTLLALLAAAPAIAAGADGGEEALEGVSYPELVERGLTQSKAGLDSGALYYLRAAARKPEAKDDPRVFAALAYLERKACRLDVALHQVQRAHRIALRTKSKMRQTVARLRRQIDRSSGWVEIDLHPVGPIVESPSDAAASGCHAPTFGADAAAPGGVRAATPPTEGAGLAATPCPAPADPASAEVEEPRPARVVFESDGRFTPTLLTRSPNALPVDPACIERARTQLSQGITDLLGDVDGAQGTVQIRLPIGDWHLADRALTVIAAETTELDLEISTRPDGIDGTTWAWIGGGVAVVVLTGTLGAIAFAPAEPVAAQRAATGLDADLVIGGGEQ